MKGSHRMCSPRDKTVSDSNVINKCNIVKNILNPSERAITKNINLSLILQVCINTCRHNKIKKNWILLDSGIISTILMKNWHQNLTKTQQQQLGKPNLENSLPSKSSMWNSAYHNSVQNILWCGNITWMNPLNIGPK